MLTFWCQTRHCEATTGIWVDAEGLQRLARQGTSIRRAACGQLHPVKEAHLKPHSDPIASTVIATLLKRRRSKERGG
jgi:uncharacterized protein YigA (DUF484 family)